MMERSNKLATGLIAGAVVGTVAGLLLAPKPGRETREMIAARAGEYAGVLRRRVGRGSTRDGDESSNDHVLAAS